MTITYIVGKNIYINLTNECTNSCNFCIRNNAEGAYGSSSLWLEREPTAEEVIAELDRYNMELFNEIVFCGYGEPTMRLEILISCAKTIKEKYNKHIRINTNGHANLIYKKDITPLFEGIIDTVSISLNNANAADYVKSCNPVFGEKAYESLIEFGRLCKKYVPNVVFSVVTTALSKQDIELCKKTAEGTGAAFRIRDIV